MGKICENIQNVHPNDIPRLALACFNLSLFNRIIIPVLALDAYFFNKRYMKKFIEMESESDVDSIDETAEKGVIETEENVIFHFQHVTEFTSIEKDIVTSLKPLSFVPKLIISPFIATILVSFAKMSSSSSVAGNLRLPQSILLPFMKQVFKNNEKHRKIRQQSAWARSIDKHEFVEIEKLLKVIQENTCKLGQNAALNGFIGLTFMLLKTKDARNLNKFAVHFLSELIKHRDEFAKDVIRILVKMLFSESNKAPVIECFNLIIDRKSLSIDRYEDALIELIENLTELDYDTALALDHVLQNALLRSSKLREIMSKTMRNAMYQNSPEMRKLAIHSFCVMLKYVKKPRKGSMNEYFGSSQNLSMLSFMSQTQLPSTGEGNMRRVGVMVLEILGILKKCFSHNAEYRVTLYEDIIDAITLNEFIIQNVVELVEPYFRDYFDNENREVVMSFENIFKQTDGGDVIVMDNLGKFLVFFITCLETAQDKKMLDEDKNQFRTYFDIIDKLIEKISEVTLNQIGVFSVLDFKASVQISQFLNCIEALMTFCCRNLDNDRNVKKFLKLFEKHVWLTKEALKIYENSKKSKKGGKLTQIGPAKKIELNLDCVWNLKTCLMYTKIIFDDSSDNENVKKIQQNIDFVRFVLKSLNQKIHQLLTSTENLKMKNSRKTFNDLKEISSHLYNQMSSKNFKNFYSVFDAESAHYLIESFKNSLLCVETIFTSRWQEFLQKITGKNDSIETCNQKVIRTIQDLIDWAFDDQDENIANEENGEKIVLNLFASYEILFKNFENISSDRLHDCFKWLSKFCTETKIDQKNLQIINSIFINSLNQDSGIEFTISVAAKISHLFGHLDDEDSVLDTDIKSVTELNLEYTFNCFVSLIKKQIDEIEFFILRMNSFNAHIKMPGQVSRNESIKLLSSLENSIVIRLKSIGKVISVLGNSRFNVKGNQIEVYGKVVINYFNCLKNLIKFLNQHFNVKKIDYQKLPIEALMKETKSTVKQVYALSPYIDDMYEEETKEAENDKKKKKSVGKKEFKYHARLVLAVEQFAASVNKFDSITKKNFSKYLHSGEVRDFRIPSSVGRPTETSSTPSQNDEDNDVEMERDEEESEKTQIDSDATMISEQSEVDESSDDDDEPLVTKKKLSNRLVLSNSSSDEVESDANEKSKSPSPVPKKKVKKNPKAKKPEPELTKVPEKRFLRRSRK